MTRHWTAMPNFVDCAVFRPAESLAEKQALRVEFDIPINAMVIISVAALKRVHKRVDYVISEFKAAARPDAFLILVGASTHETPGILTLAGDDPRIRILQDYPHEKISRLLRVADVMVLGSLFEMMPIAVLEGLASGLPVISNDHPVMAWMTGAEGGRHQTIDYRPPTTDLNVRETIDYRPPTIDRSAGRARLKSDVDGRMSMVSSSLCGGRAIDMSQEGALAQALAGLTPEWLAVHGRNARERAEKMFSRDVVIGQYVEYYREVIMDRDASRG